MGTCGIERIDFVIDKFKINRENKPWIEDLSAKNGLKGLLLYIVICSRGNDTKFNKEGNCGHCKSKAKNHKCRRDVTELEWLPKGARLAAVAPLKNAVLMVAMPEKK